MKSQKKPLEEEIQPLLKESTVAEASQRVWEQFEEALESLNSESVQLLTDYFNGASVKTLSEQKNLKQNEIEALISRAKKDLMERLRRNCKVRQ